MSIEVPIMNGIWYMAGMVSPTIILLAAHHQNPAETAVRIFPVSKVKRQRKKDFLRPILSLRSPNP